jgi:hypothetical protein
VEFACHTRSEVATECKSWEEAEEMACADTNLGESNEYKTG